MVEIDRHNPRSASSFEEEYRPKVLVFLSFLLPVLACSCTHVSERRVRELQPAVAAASHLPSGPEDFSFIDPIAKGKKILFVGETPHREEPIRLATLGLSLHLRRGLGYSVLAKEGVYSDWPFMEAQSLGSEWNAANVVQGLECIPEPDLAPLLAPVITYNRSVPKDQRLLCTALDLDHTIGRPKPQAALYLGYLASKSSSSEARAELARAIPALLGKKSAKEIRAFLDRLEQKFHGAWSSFSPADQDEIAFSLALERASIDYHKSLWRKSWKRETLRGEYFRKTIERAFTKAERSNGALVCYVGGAHAELNPRWRINDEARYFSQEHPAFRGQVASIRIERISRFTEGFDGLTVTALEKAALALMGDKDRIFVDLRDKSWDSVKHRPKEFFPKNGPNYDGVLFLK